MKNLNVRYERGKKLVFSVAFLLLFATAAVAQVAQPQMQQPVRENFTDQELEQFVDVYVQVMEIQQENESRMLETIEEENLDLARFNEILQAQQQQQLKKINATPEELNAFSSAAQKIIAVQQEAQSKMEEVIAEDLGLKAYQQIVVAYQQNPKVQERVNVMLQEKIEE